MDPTGLISRPPIIGTRRLASPVRVTLSSQLGGDVDGAWWPHTACLARELPDLVEALYRPLGGVSDIAVNWSSTQAPPSLDAVRADGTSAVPGHQYRHHHLMTLTGRRGRARLLIVPCLTGTNLAIMVLRRAAGMPVTCTEQETKLFQLADYIVRTACAETAFCDARLQ